jgi:hypothetical protein
MRLSHRLMAITTILFGATLAGPAPVAADDLRPRVVAAEMGAADVFRRGKLNDAELNAVSGFGADASGEAGAPETGDVSVILFDELGRPKRNGLSPGTGAGSTVVRGVTVQVGR